MRYAPAHLQSLHRSAGGTSRAAVSDEPAGAHRVDGCGRVCGSLRQPHPNLHPESRRTRSTVASAARASSALTGGLNRLRRDRREGPRRNTQHEGRDEAELARPGLPGSNVRSAADAWRESVGDAHTDPEACEDLEEHSAHQVDERRGRPEPYPDDQERHSGGEFHQGSAAQISARV